MGPICGPEGGILFDPWPLCFFLTLVRAPEEQYPSVWDALDDHQLLVPGPEELPAKLKEVLEKQPDWAAWR